MFPPFHEVIDHDRRGVRIVGLAMTQSITRLPGMVSESCIPRPKLVVF
jgi:hypothetical protein